MTLSASPVRQIPVIDAIPETSAAFGTLITPDVTSRMEIPYYRGRVIEGGDIGFRYRGRACMRTARIMPSDTPVRWLERHQHLTQLFVGLGDAPFIMVLAPPNPDEPGDLPDLDATLALRVPAGSGLLLHRGTWHDFPIACDRPVSLLIANSEEVVDALQAAGRPRELHEGDVRKISLRERFGVELLPMT
jgi:ureidoglycolate lyase